MDKVAEIIKEYESRTAKEKEILEFLKNSDPTFLKEVKGFLK